MSKEIKCQLLKPFGSTIAKSTMPDELVNDFLKDLTTIREDQDKNKTHAFGHRLAGQLHKELLITPEVMLKWKAKFFDPVIKYYAASHYLHSEVNKIKINAAWHNIQKSGDYNPAHTHTHFQQRDISPDLSCVGYLKLPESITNHKHAKEHHNVGGFIEFMEGSEGMFTNGNYLIQPAEKVYYLFPANLRHCVYPFYSNIAEAERISFSFNATLVLEDKTQNEQK